MLALLWAWTIECTTAVADQSACFVLLNHPRPSGKLVHWALTIQELDLVIKYRSGRSITNADMLSRNPVATASQADKISYEVRCAGNKTTASCQSSCNGIVADECMTDAPSSTSEPIENISEPIAKSKQPVESIPRSSDTVGGCTVNVAGSEDLCEDKGVVIDCIVTCDCKTSSELPMEDVNLLHILSTYVILTNE